MLYVRRVICGWRNNLSIKIRLRSSRLTSSFFGFCFCLKPICAARAYFSKKSLHKYILDIYYIYMCEKENMQRYMNKSHITLLFCFVSHHLKTYRMLPTPMSFKNACSFLNCIESEIVKRSQQRRSVYQKTKGKITSSYC